MKKIKKGKNISSQGLNKLRQKNFKKNLKHYEQNTIMWTTYQFKFKIKILTKSKKLICDVAIRENV